MSPVFAARRRAEEFATLVEDPSAAGSDSARYAHLLELVGAMREAPAPQARPEFVADLRSRLVAEAANATVPAEAARLTLPARRTSRERKIAALVGGLAIVGASTSVAMASEQSLPGDALYPVKRAIEDVHTRISLGDADKGHTVLANADDRLAEATALAGSGDAADGARVAGTLDDFADQATQASDLLLADYAQSGSQDSVTQLRAFAASSLDRLTTLEPVVPPEARDELVHAAKVLVAIDAAADQACPACGGGITSIPPIFAASSPTSGEGGHGATGSGSRSTAHHQQSSGTDHQSSPALPLLPGLAGQTLPPGSVLGPSGGSDPSASPSSDPTKDPIGTLTDPLTGGLTGGGSSPSPSPDLGGTVGGTLDGLGDTVGGLTDGLTDGQP